MECKVFYEKKVVKMLEILEPLLSKRIANKIEKIVENPLFYKIKNS